MKLKLKKREWLVQTLARIGQEQRAGTFPAGSGLQIQVAPPRGRHVRSLHPFH
jgi:hypothetical protein